MAISATAIITPGERPDRDATRAASPRPTSTASTINGVDSTLTPSTTSLASVWVSAAAPFSWVSCDSPEVSVCSCWCAPGDSPAASPFVCTAAAVGSWAWERSAIAPTTNSAVAATSSAASTVRIASLRFRREEQLDHRPRIRRSGDLQDQVAVVVTQVEVQERAARGLGGNEFARALVDLGCVAQAHEQPGVGR